MNIMIYSTLHESECDMEKYFTSRLIYFHEPEGVKIKPKSEIFSHVTLPECNKWFIPC